MPEGIPKKIIGGLRLDVKQQKNLFSSWQEHEGKIFKGKEANKPYLIYDDNLEDLEYPFREMNGGCGFESYLRKRFSERIGNLIGVELGGPGSNFFGGFSRDVFSETLGITTKDLRSNYQTPEEKKRDETNNHSIIEADIFSQDGLKNLDKWLAGKKIDFLMERMQGGWEANVQSMPLFAKYFARYYERLGENGCMFLQTPFFADGFNIMDVHNYNVWKSLLRQKYGKMINIDARQYVIKIEKIKGSPGKISTLRF